MSDFLNIPTYINYKKIVPEAIEPTFGSQCAAGMDLYALCEEPVTIQPGETHMIHTGIAIEIPYKFFGALYPRSGLASKRGLRLANCVGVVDADYRGEVMVPLHNDSDKPQTIENGDRIAQLVIQPYLYVELVEKDKLSSTVRGTGGFGSTGVHTRGNVNDR